MVSFYRQIRQARMGAVARPAGARRARTRWALPAGVVAAVAAVIAGSALSAAQAAPSLPPRTPAQLLAALANGRTPPPPLSGTVVETASLGLPQLPGMDRQSSLTGLLAGTHTIKVWYADPRHARLSLPVPMGETDLVRDGSTLWLWQSASDSVTRFALPPRAPGGAEPHPAPVPLTPQQAARQIMAAVGPTTALSVDRTATVAGEPAYQLALAPKSSRSLVGRVTIALDARHLQVPLRVQVFARGAAKPAFQVGFTSLSFAAPAASIFHFTPPAGASVHRVAAPAPGAWRRVRASAPDAWRQAPPPVRSPAWREAIPTRAGQRHVAVPARGAPWRARAGAAPVGWIGPPPTGWVIRPSSERLTGPGGPPTWSGVPGTAPRVVGTGWLSVLVLPATALSGRPGAGSAAGAAGATGQAARSLAGQGGNGPGLNGAAMFAALMQTARPVHGAWGSGKLLRTSLLSVLITKDHVFAGAVTPAVLFQAASLHR